jgi:hypothetical protein
MVSMKDPSILKLVDMGAMGPAELTAGSHDHLSQEGLVEALWQLRIYLLWEHIFPVIGHLLYPEAELTTRSTAFHDLSWAF